MEKFLKRKAPDSTNNARSSCPDLHEINWNEEIEYDPGLRKPIDAYHPNLRDRVRRKYLENGPCQPRTFSFPVTKISDRDRKFNPNWFDEFGGWLEYSKEKDRAYCFFVSYLETLIRKRMGIKHLLQMVGMVGIEKTG